MARSKRFFLFFSELPKKKTDTYITRLSKLHHTRVRVCVSKSLLETKKESEQERGRETWCGLWVFVSRVPVYLFLLWVARVIHVG
jgi:hypothetical protein